MKKTAVFYGSTTGNHRKDSRNNRQQNWMQTFFTLVKLHLKICPPYENLVLGTSTWGIGDLQDDWENGIELLSKVELGSKKVAIFGLGDQMGYPDSFVDGMKAIYDRVIEGKGIVVGHCDTDGYDLH